MIKIHETKMNGNCLYESISKILKSIGIKYSTLFIKKIIILNILKNNKIIVEWYNITKDAMNAKNNKLLQEFLHMIPVIQKNIDPISSIGKKILYTEMIKPTYWGDELTILEFEKQFNIQCNIFDNIHNKLQPPLTHIKSIKTYYDCYLLYSNNHYQPISFDNRFLFKKNNYNK
jgi:hypothetical protein